MLNPEAPNKYKLPKPVEGFTVPEVQYHYVLVREVTPEYGHSIISQGYIGLNGFRHK